MFVYMRLHRFAWCVILALRITSSNSTAAFQSKRSGIMPRRRCICCGFLELAVVSQMRPFSDHLLFAFAPPRPFRAGLFGLKDEAFGLNDVEEQLSDHCGGR